MYRMLKTNGKSNCFELCWKLFLLVCKSPTLSLTFHKTEISWLFLRLFNLLCFILYYFCERWILSCEFTPLKGKKNFEDMLCIKPRRYVSGSLHLHLRANYPSFWRFPGGKNVAFDFSDACLFGHPVYFDYQDFFKLRFRLSCQHYNVGKLWGML